MDKTILTIIKDIHEKNVSHDPCFATYSEIIREVKDILNFLTEQNIITVGHTINDKYIKLKRT